ncbi:MAG: FISUMP domain-containing protein [Candidatus Zixiibacteriota bacterium]
MMGKTFSTIVAVSLLAGAIALVPIPGYSDAVRFSDATTLQADGCCVGRRGNVDGIGIIDLVDLSSLVNYLQGGGFVLPCPEAANVNGVGIIDLADLSSLVNYLTTGQYIPPNCPTNTVTDIDGNVYQTVTIGSQVWMASNLRVTHYRNGDSIPNVTDSTVWPNLMSGAYCDYHNDTTLVPTYGRLYNWYAVADSRAIAPSGWHVPSDSEWQALVVYLGDSTVAGGKMKEAGYAHWFDGNVGATNASGFNGLPGGYRYGTGSCLDMTVSAYYWSSTESAFSYAWSRWLSCYAGGIYHIIRPKLYGFSVRCVKDQ